MLNERKRTRRRAFCRHEQTVRLDFGLAPAADADLDLPRVPADADPFHADDPARLVDHQGRADHGLLHALEIRTAESDYYSGAGVGNLYLSVVCFLPRQFSFRGSALQVQGN